MIETFKAVLSNKQEEGEEKQTDRKTQRRTVGMREGQRERELQTVAKSCHAFNDYLTLGKIIKKFKVRVL